MDPCWRRTPPDLVRAILLQACIDTRLVLGVPPRRLDTRAFEWLTAASSAVSRRNVVHFFPREDRPQVGTLLVLCTSADGTFDMDVTRNVESVGKGRGKSYWRFTNETLRHSYQLYPDGTVADDAYELCTGSVLDDDFITFDLHAIPAS
jgi:hypothetical protein